MSDDRARSVGLFYGWVVVGALALVLGIGVGITFYGISIYLAALSKGPDSFSLSLVSIATGTFLLVGGTSGLGVAWMLERLDPRLVLVGGLVVSAVAVLCIGQVSAEWHLVLAYGLLGVGFAAISVIPASNLIASWFVRRRTLAMSITFTGLPIGGALLSPPIAALVEARGVSGASPWLAGALLLVAGPVTLFLRPDPASQGTTPDGDPVAPHTHVVVTGVALREAVRSPWFVVVTTALTLGMLSQLGVLSHVYNAVEERLDASVAAATVSLLAASSLVGRIAGGWALARVRLRHATVGFLLVQGLAILALAFASGPGTVFAATAAFGLTIGNMQVIQPLLLAEQFGNRDFARILARGNLLVMVGMAAGPVVVGMLHDSSGDYRGALVTAAFPALLGAAFMVWSRRLELPRTDLDDAFPIG